MTQMPMPPIPNGPVWDRTTFFDAPEIWLQQVLEKDWAALGVHPAHMSLQERQGLASAQIAQNPESTTNRFLTNLVTNPFVWLGVAMAVKFPIPNALKAFSLHERLSPIVAEQGGFLHQLKLNRLLGPNHIYSGTSIAPLLRFVERTKREMDEGLWRTLEPEIRKILTARGTDKLTDYDDLLIALKLQGADTAVTHRYLRYIQPASGAKNPLGRLERISEVVDPFVDRDLLDQEISRLGLWDLFHAQKKVYGDVADKLLNDEQVASRIARGVRKGALGLDNVDNPNLGWKLISDLLGLGDEVALAKSLKLTDKEVADAIKWAMPTRADNYLPRNAFRYYRRKADGAVAEMTSRELENFQLRGETPRMLRGARSLHERAYGLPIWDPNDLQRVSHLAGSNTEKFNELVEMAGKRITQMETGEIPSGRFVRLSASHSFRNYVDQASRTWALYGKEVDDDLLRILRDNDRYYNARANNDPGFWKQLQNQLGDDADIDSVRARPGGANAFDFMERDYHAMVDQYDNFAKSSFLSTWLPLATGATTSRTGIFTNGVIATQQLLKRGLDGGLRQNFTDAGLGALAKKLDDFADYQLGPKEVDGGIARWFYGTTLGINLGSVVLNATQVANALRFVSPGSAAEGMTSALKKYSDYLKIRMGQIQSGGKFLGREAELDRLKALRQVFGDAEDIGIAEIDVDIERIIRSPKMEVKSSKFSRFEEGLLKIFTHGERFNRVATREMAVAELRRQGIDIAEEVTELGGRRLRDPRAREFVTRVVDETQFTPTMTNSPFIFANPNSPLSNPALKQFLTFPVRQLTSLWMGGRLWETPPKTFGFLQGQDIWRTVGYSAIMYEAFKGMGAQMFEATPLGAGTAIYRDFGPFSPLPVPPAVTVPFQGLSAIVSGDIENLQRVLPVLVPGGIAINRALGFVPGVGEAATSSGFVRTYADYENPMPDGSFPVYDGNGRLVEFMTEWDIIKTASGVNRFGAVRQDEEVIDFLRKQRERMGSMRSEYLNALSQGKHAKAERLQKDFERTFGMPLKISKSQWDNFNEARTTTRVERALSTMPREFRDSVGDELRRALGSGHYADDGKREALEKQMIER